MDRMSIGSCFPFPLLCQGPGGSPIKFSSPCFGAESSPIDRGLAGPVLLAHVLTAKYGDHLLLYRQAEIYARAGVEPLGS